MEVANDGWYKVGAGAQSRLLVQNVGDTRIGFIVQADADDPDDNTPAVVLDEGDHGLLLPGMPPATFDDLATGSVSLYVRSLGPKDGLLYVYEETA